MIARRITLVGEPHLSKCIEVFNFGSWWKNVTFEYILRYKYENDILFINSHSSGDVTNGEIV